MNDLAARGLLKASADADLLVVGGRGLGRFRELVLGSVSQQCLHHAKIPIAIVREDTGPEFGPQRIVVGVDGSETSQRALGGRSTRAGCADLVLGSRGLGGFKGLLLGSVSHRITHHAPCPVVVIPPVEPADSGRRAAMSAA